jgi:hypothetical protein
MDCLRRLQSPQIRHFYPHYAIEEQDWFQFHSGWTFELPPSFGAVLIFQLVGFVVFPMLVSGTLAEMLVE